MPADANKIRRNYLANLALQISNNQKNWNANQIFQTTGVTPTEPSDPRSRTDIGADVEDMKVQLRQALASKITDWANANKVVDMLNYGDDVRAMLDMLPKMETALKPTYKSGVPADVILTWFDRNEGIRRNDALDGLDLSQRLGMATVENLDAIGQSMATRHQVDDLLRLLAHRFGAGFVGGFGLGGAGGGDDDDDGGGGGGGGGSRGRGFDGFIPAEDYPEIHAEVEDIVASGDSGRASDFMSDMRSRMIAREVAMDDEAARAEAIVGSAGFGSDDEDLEEDSLEVRTPRRRMSDPDATASFPSLSAGSRRYSGDSRATASFGSDWSPVRAIDEDSFELEAAEYVEPIATDVSEIPMMKAGIHFAEQSKAKGLTALKENANKMQYQRAANKELKQHQAHSAMEVLAGNADDRKWRRQKEGIIQDNRDQLAQKQAMTELVINAAKGKSGRATNDFVDAHHNEQLQIKGLKALDKGRVLKGVNDTAVAHHNQTLQRSGLRALRENSPRAKMEKQELQELKSNLQQSLASPLRSRRLTMLLQRKEQALKDLDELKPMEPSHQAKRYSRIHSRQAETKVLTLKEQREVEQQLGASRYVVHKLQGIKEKIANLLHKAGGMNSSEAKLVGLLKESARKEARQRVSVLQNKRQSIESGREYFFISDQEQKRASEQFGLAEAEIRKTMQEIEDDNGDEVGHGIKRMVRGKGLSSKEGVPASQSYISMGKHFIHKHKLLHDNILQIRRKSGTTINHLPTQKVSTQLATVLLKLIGNDHPTFEDMQKLADNDRALMNKIIKNTKIDDRLMLPTPERTEEEQEWNRFQVLVGETHAGNNSPELIKELKGLLLKMAHTNRLPKGQVREILMDLTAMGH
jgi:hypothetical protein